MMIESLEARIAPAGVLLFIDVDGDMVKVTSDRGDLLAAGVATFDATGHQLQRLTLTDASFQGANLSTTVTKAATGDGLVNIGRINASGRDLGSVVIKGDLGGILCGDGDSSTIGLRLLSARSMGLYGVAPQGAGSLSSAVEGSIGSIKITTDMLGVSIGARDFNNSASGNIGSVSVGGSLIGTYLFSTGNMGPVTIGGDIVGGEFGSSGGISCAGTLSVLRLAGSLVGGTDFLSGRIFAGTLADARIGGDIIGGTGPASGAVHGQFIRSLVVGGSLIGGSGDHQFSTYVDNVDVLVDGQVLAFKNMGSVKIGGDALGGAGFGSGEINSLGSMGAVSIGGSLIGGAGAQSAKIQSTLGMGAVKIGGDVIGGDGLGSAEVYLKSRDAGLASVSIGGSLRGGSGAASGLVQSNADMGPVKIAGDVIGSSGVASGNVLAAGRITSIQVGGSVVGGSGTSSGIIVSGGDMGPLRIGGDLRGGSIAPGEPTLERSGFIQGGRIASVWIGGSVVAGVDDSTTGELVTNASIRANDDLGPLTIKGGLRGTSTVHGTTLVVISARGPEMPGTAGNAAIQSVSIGGRVQLAQILAGYNVLLTPANGNASIGAVRVGGDWIASSLVAGVQDTGGNGFGNADDAPIPGPAADAVFSRIASITIGGLVSGTAAPGDHFGFCAQRIGSFKSFNFHPLLTAGVDVIELSLPTGDVTLRQV